MKGVCRALLEKQLFFPPSSLKVSALHFESSGSNQESKTYHAKTMNGINQLRGFPNGQPLCGCTTQMDGKSTFGESILPFLLNPGTCGFQALTPFKIPSRSKKLLCLWKRIFIFIGCWHQAPLSFFLAMLMFFFGSQLFISLYHISDAAEVSLEKMNILIMRLHYYIYSICVRNTSWIPRKGPLDDDGMLLSECFQASHTTSWMRWPKIIMCLFFLGLWQCVAVVRWLPRCCRSQWGKNDKKNWCYTHFIENVTVTKWSRITPYSLHSVLRWIVR